MISRSEYAEARAICLRLTAVLIAFPLVGLAGANLRTAVGKLLANFYELAEGGTVGTQLLLCFDLAREAGANLTLMDSVREAAEAEAPVYSVGVAVVNAAIIFTLVEQSQIIAGMTFASRGEVDALMDAMSIIIDEIKLRGSESFSVADYRNVVSLSALLIYHLSATERQLPRLVAYQLPDNLPALTLSNFIYGDATHSDELVAENDTVHPAFMQRAIVALGVT
jgi:prophage DNA circulation protein